MTFKSLKNQVKQNSRGVWSQKALPGFEFRIFTFTFVFLGKLLSHDFLITRVKIMTNDLT